MGLAQGEKLLDECREIQKNVVNRVTSIINDATDLDECVSSEKKACS